MNKEQTWSFFIWAGVILVVEIIAAGFYQADPNKGFSNAGAILTFITLASVGIERIIEGFWTFIGLTKGTFWPFSAFSEQISNLSTELNATLTPFYEQWKQVVDETKTTKNWT